LSLTTEGQTKEATFVGMLSGNEIHGTVTIEGHAPGSFTATRAPESEAQRAKKKTQPEFFCSSPFALRPLLFAL
jgi:hypothetical protein